MSRWLLLLQALLTLFRAFTGESWHYIMYDMAAEAPGCVADMDGLPWEAKADMCGYRWVAGHVRVRDGQGLSNVE